ncbi:localization factor PodJL [Rhizobium sp. PP-F2F-G48]|uniref:peptidoglycan-binding protein n=1 Tax=Rhizobium sp. PP-F2F-G48 TaxID=2135651 RepID=UPI0010486023|nr:peptidoglycan-binding protein [Rhizobium sp. PP-F2F-G48]TCM56119.1 localization factor PodJL [Rhizobium sp. PP-F2F-G48]
MNGSRSTPPRMGTPADDRLDGRHGERSSLEALNRTIEGLEARIEGLIAPAKRETRPPEAARIEAGPAAERPVSRADAISEILQRQRALSATRLEKATERHRIQTRAPSADAPAYSEPAPFLVPPSSPAVSRTADRHVMPAYDDDASLRSAREPARAAPRPVPQPAPPVMPDAAVRDIATALVGLRQDLKRDIEQGLSREMSSLRNEMHGIAAAATQGDALAQDIRKDLQRLSLSLGNLGRQPTTSESHALRADLDEMRAVIDGLAREDSVRRMESRWTGVEDRLNVFDAARDDELVALAYRLDEIKSQLGTMNNGPALYALEDKLVAVAQAIDLIGRHMQPDDRRFQEQFADLDARLDEISRAIVASGRTASASDSPGVTRVETRLVDLSRQIEDLAYPADHGLAARIEALSARVEDLLTAEAAARLEERLDHLSAMMERAERASAQPDLTGHLADISAKIDALDTGDVSDTLARRFDDLARRIDNLDGPAPLSDDRFLRLEGQLSGIAQRLDETHAAPYDDGEVLRSLQDQIANLSFLISQPRETAPAVPAEVEGRMNALEDYLASSDEYIIEAARQAAEAVMEAYTRNGMTQSASPAIADIAAISALADDLKTLEDLSRSSDERTARTFEALHETLVHIADKLERIEERALAPALRDEAAPAFGRRDTGAPMPRAETPVFLERDEGDDSYADLTRTMRATVAMPADMSARMPMDLRDHDVHVSENAGAEAPHFGVAELREPADLVPADAPNVDAPAARTGLLSGLTSRFSAKRAKPAAPVERRFVDPTPSIDALETINPDAANQLLEPGSGTPDVKKILERVRAGQAVRPPVASESDKSDFIAAARRAAQQAAQEVDTGNRTAARPGAAPSALARHRRPILMAVGAVLLAILSYPLVSTLMKNEQAAAPVTAIETPADRDAALAEQAPVEQAPAEPSPALAAPTTDTPPEARDEGVAPLSSLQPQGGATEGAASMTAQPETEAMAPAAEASTPGASSTVAPAAATSIDVPAEIVPAALADAARAGDPKAYFEIGAVYTEGRGVKADFAKAAEWYQRAADAGVVPAQYRLGSLYEKGTGVPRDPAKARALYQQAAESGNANAMHNLAVMLASGNGTNPDFTLASMWFAKAADLGVRDSQFNLAILYARGNGVAKDLVESYKWFAVAAADGDTDAAQKRDQVEKELSPDQMTAAKAKVAAWKPAALDPKGNDTTVPDTWVGKGTKTSSVDMKKAVRNIQAILNNNGFDAGTPDGALGAKTVTAIKAFQTSIGQEPNGRITDALVKELLKRNG